jgi:hypothetical protein
LREGNLDPACRSFPRPHQAHSQLKLTRQTIAQTFNNPIVTADDVIALEFKAVICFDATATKSLADF